MTKCPVTKCRCDEMDTTKCPTPFFRGEYENSELCGSYVLETFDGGYPRIVTQLRIRLWSTLLSFSLNISDYMMYDIFYLSLFLVKVICTG